MAILLGQLAKRQVPISVSSTTQVTTSSLKHFFLCCQRLWLLLPYSFLQREIFTSVWKPNIESNDHCQSWKCLCVSKEQKTRVSIRVFTELHSFFRRSQNISSDRTALWAKGAYQINGKYKEGILNLTPLWFRSLPLGCDTDVVTLTKRKIAVLKRMALEVPIFPWLCVPPRLCIPFYQTDFCVWYWGEDTIPGSWMSCGGQAFLKQHMWPSLHVTSVSAGSAAAALLAHILMSPFLCSAG